MAEVDTNELRAKVAFARRERDKLRDELERAEVEFEKLRNALEVIDDMSGSPELPMINDLKDTGLTVSVSDLITTIFESRPDGSEFTVKNIETMLAPHGISNTKTISGVLSKLVKSGRLENKSRGRYSLGQLGKSGGAD